MAHKALEPQAVVVVLLESEPSESCGRGCLVHSFTAQLVLFFYGRNLTRWIIPSKFKKTTLLHLSKSFNPHPLLTELPLSEPHLQKCPDPGDTDEVIFRAHSLEIKFANSFLVRSYFLALKTFPIPFFRYPNKL